MTTDHGEAPSPISEELEAEPSGPIAASTGDLTYETAVERLEEIIARLDSNETGLRETLALCREGKLLIEFAAGELEAVGRGLEELRLDDLVARLELAGPAAR